MFSNFLKFIYSVKEKLGNYPNEQAVCIGIVQPILKYLGWDVYNPKYVCPQYPLGKGKVDYGLKISEEENKELPCIIEVKAEGKLKAEEKLTDADRQLLGYAFIDGVPLAVLTDGRLWKFYLPMNAGKIDKRLVCTLDFRKHESEKIIEELDRYLSFKNTRSGKGVRNAKRDLNEKIKKNKAEKNIRVAWENLLHGPSDKLIILLIEEASQISSGYAPAKNDVETFLKNLDISEPKLKTLPKAEPKKPKVEKSKKEVSFFLFSEEYSSNATVTSAFVKILEILVRKNQKFSERLAQKTAGKKYHMLSQNKEELSPVGQKIAKKLPNGWWVNTNLSTNSKKGVLKKACEVAGIPFGKSSGLKVNF